MVKSIKTMNLNQMSHNYLYLSLSLVIILVCFSCKEREAYYNFHEFPSAEWLKSDTLTFIVDSESIETNMPYKIELELVNNNNYPYQNIWLYITDDFSGQPYSDEKQYLLADERGRWSGAGFGSVYQLTLEYKDKVVFKDKRSYTLKVVHRMKDEKLIGIEKFGLNLLKE